MQGWLIKVILFSNALRQAHISERDVTKGKVYFFNGFFDARLSSPGEPQTILRK